jgi:hypothetical protein
MVRDFAWARRSSAGKRSSDLNPREVELLHLEGFVEPHFHPSWSNSRALSISRVQVAETS